MAGAVIVHHTTRYKTYSGEITGIVVFACLIASVAGCIFGYDIGLTCEHCSRNAKSRDCSAALVL